MQREIVFAHSLILLQSRLEERGEGARNVKDGESGDGNLLRRVSTATDATAQSACVKPRE